MKKLFVMLVMGLTMVFCCNNCSNGNVAEKSPVEYVNPYIGNISHLLVPTYPTVHLPNSMLRVYPERSDFTSEQVEGLPIVVTSHRGKSAFNLSPCNGDLSHQVISYRYDREKIKPYLYEVTLEDDFDVRYVPSHQSALYEIKYRNAGAPAYMLINSGNGGIRIESNAITGYQLLDNDTKVYIYVETDIQPVEKGILVHAQIDSSKSEAAGKNVCAVLRFPEGTDEVKVRYGISFIDEKQAQHNLRREIKDYKLEALKQAAVAEWNKVLSKIEVKGGSESDKTIFHTALYRTFERPVCISEDGRYFSAFDGRIHEDNGEPFYTDDWIWDTYRATHPLRVLIAERLEKDVISSYLRMAEQMGNMWMPTFPEVTGDSRRMNSNHAAATVADALAKGLDIDAEKAYEACRRGIEEKTLAPWSGKPAGWIDDFYKKNGYIPALKEGEKENDPNVTHFEKRQPVAVTLGTSYDQWCLSQIASRLGLVKDANHYLACSYNYRNIFNPHTSFFHPKDKDGNWIEPFNYDFPGGMGAREYYGENNGWVYRWDVPHNIADLINLMGGREKFIANLDQTFSQPLGRPKFAFYAKFPDHTGNVGQFSMANEPSLHVPYLYNYAGEPWKTQKCIRKMLKTWFRNDLMGIPGDEDGGGLTAFIVFSSMGFYPVTPGMPVYNIGSPLFEEVTIHLDNGKDFTIKADKVSDDNKYIQSAILDGKTWDKPWFCHETLVNGGCLELKMGDRPNKKWGADEGAAPPSADMPIQKGQPAFKSPEFK